MNSETEIRQAYLDFHSGKFGGLTFAVRNLRGPAAIQLMTGRPTPQGDSLGDHLYLLAAPGLAHHVRWTAGWRWAYGHDQLGDRSTGRSSILFPVRQRVVGRSDDVLVRAVRRQHGHFILQVLPHAIAFG